MILTRGQEDIEKDRKYFEEFGFEVVPLPMIRSLSLDFVLSEDTYDWVLFQSVRSVKYFLKRHPIPPGSKIIAVGDKTRRFIEETGYSVFAVPRDRSASGMVEFMKGMKRGKVLIPRSAKGLRTLIDGLAELGFHVVDIPVYDLETVTYPSGYVEDVLKEGGFLVFASPSAVNALFENLQKPSNLRSAKGLVVVAIGKTTKKELRKMGVEGVLMPSEPLMEEVARTVWEFWHNSCTL